MYLGRSTSRHMTTGEELVSGEEMRLASNFSDNNRVSCYPIHKVFSDAALKHGQQMVCAYYFGFFKIHSRIGFCLKFHLVWLEWIYVGEGKGLIWFMEVAMWGWWDWFLKQSRRQVQCFWVCFFSLPF